MNFPAAVKSCFSKYATFSGRASRSEYWYFQLFICLMLAVLVALMLVDPDAATVVGIAGCLFYLGIFLPGLAVTVRRLHDRNRSGWHYLWVLVPFGAIAVLIWACQEGIEGDNRFGPDPLATQ